MNIKSMTLPELTATIKEMGQPAFRGKQSFLSRKNWESRSSVPSRFLLGCIGVSPRWMQ